VSQAAPAPPGLDDDDDDDDERFDEDEELLDDDALEVGAVAGCFLSLLHAATSAATQSKTKTFLMTIVRRTGADGARLVITT
jgi:hypothetical protein